MKKFSVLFLCAIMSMSVTSFADYQEYGEYYEDDYTQEYGEYFEDGYTPDHNVNNGYFYYDHETLPKEFVDFTNDFVQSQEKYKYMDVNTNQITMPKYSTEKERLANLCRDTGYYYDAKHRKPANQQLVDKVLTKVNNTLFDKNGKIKSQKVLKSHMKTITVNVWQIGKDNKKYKKTMNITVLTEIAPDVQAIFKEIFEGKEKFPIHSIGGYDFRGGIGFHPLGLAIDINPTYNAQFKQDGVTPIVGKYYNPSKYPQSIGKDSDVVKAFGKRGWTWGAKFDKPDMMHFSYLEW